MKQGLPPVALTYTVWLLSNFVPGHITLYSAAGEKNR